MRFYVGKRTDGGTLKRFVEGNTEEWAVIYSDELRGAKSVKHGEREWARDEDGDGKREVHINRIEGIWTTLRNFLRGFRGVSKVYLSGYVAIVEIMINFKTISPYLIHSLTSAPF